MERQLEMGGRLALKLVDAPLWIAGRDDVETWQAMNHRHFNRRAQRVREALKAGFPTLFGDLYLKLIRASGDEFDLGLVSRAVITTAGVNYLVDAFQGLSTFEPENLRYHGIGTGAVAEAVGDTTLGAELTTQYNPDNTRATGTLTEGATANIYRTVGVNVVDATVSITEHGIFSQAATGGGTLWDRSVFSAVAMVSGDSLQTRYDLTLAAGS